MAKAATTPEKESKRALAATLGPMSDEELRAEFERQENAKPPAKTPTKSVTDVLAQLEAVEDVRLESDGAGVATCRELTPSALQDLFANRACALRVPGFTDTNTCNELARWIADRPAHTWGGTDTAYSAGIPLNALSWSVDEAIAYFKEALPAMRAIRGAAKGLSPLDKLRLELDELWPSGATVSRDNPYRRKMLVGLARVMRPETLLDGITRVEGMIHTDSSMFLDSERGLFSANIYLDVPTSGGELNIFPVAMQQPERLQRLVRVIAYLLQYSFDPVHRERVQRQLHARLPPPVTLTPSAGDLIVLNTGRPHAVRGFTEGTRVSLQAFALHEGARPLQLFS
jgi:hypothetical protein